MTALDMKNIGDLMKSAGPTEDHRQAFGRTFLGTLLGQTIILVGMLLTYVVAIVLLWKYAIEDLRAIHAAVGVVLFWLIIAAPIICILLFSILPTARRASRERSLKAAVIGGDIQFKAGYFRLHPYGASDRETFTRLDGADRAILAWLRSTDASILYLSGASGVGKSSLLAANILPRLRDSGWTVIETRSFGDPIERLRATLFADECWRAKEPSPELSLRDLLKKVAESSARKRDAPLLLVIDQFEEFLILHREEERGTFAALLVDLANNPIDDLRILLVFRSDYLPLVFKLNLPPLTAGQNWNELAAYDRGEATSFLQSGGRELSPQAIDALFRGLDRIEEAPGIYRPITLNMIGLVLERMGRTLEGDPGRLIQSYLTTCLTRSESRDFAKPLLAQMITDSGTKEPRSEADLAQLTGFESWQVKAALADLARQGLVRQLEAPTTLWEIAHDFLARVIGQLIGRLKPNALQRARPLVAPVVLLGWIALAAIALPYWTTVQEQASEAALRRLGAAFSGPSGKEESSEIWVTWSLFDDAALNAARPHLERINPHVLDFSHARTKSLEPLKGLANLSSLNLSYAEGITSLEPLKGLTNLSSLNLSYVRGITSLEPLKGLTNLSQLDLVATDVTSLEPLKRLTNLSSLDLSRVRGITSLEPLKGLTNLHWLNLAEATGITSLEPLKGLTNLRWLNLSEANGITSLKPLKGLEVKIEGASLELRATMK
jgi:internalin A